jgi:predicted Zn-dependent peptidase
MEYKNFKSDAYNLYIIKTDKFKTVHMEIMFRSTADKSRMPKRTFLSDLLTDTSKKYPNRKDVVIRLEELYKSIFYGTTNKTGNVFNTIFVYDMISPSFINDESYYEDALKFPFEMILNPSVINDEFAIREFNVVKERMKIDIQSLEENPVKMSIHNALLNAAPNTCTSYSILGTLDELEQISPSNLYQEYQNMITNDLCDIFIIGDIDENKTYEIIQKYFSLRTIKNHEVDYYVENELGNGKKSSDNGPFVQTSLEMIYNIVDLSFYEKNIVFHVFNYILGNGGITSKLYKKVREENSLCYGVSSMYLKYDKMLLIQVSLEDENKDKAIKLIKECMTEMIKGKFSDDDLEDAKNNLILSIEMSQDNNISILNNYVFNVFDKLPTYDERKKMFSEVTKEEVMELAKKLKLNSIYYLSGGQNGEN